MMNAEPARRGSSVTPSRVPFADVAVSKSSGTPPLFTKRRRRAPALVLVVLLIAIAGGAFWWFTNRDGDELVEPVAACDVPVEILERLWNGYYPERSGDVLTVEQQPHQFGTRHSTPYAYTQDVPLVL